MERDTLKMKNKTKLIYLLGLVVLALGGCGWQFVAFSYDTVIEAEPAVNNLASADPIIGADGEEVPLAYTTPMGGIITGNPVADVFVTMMQNSGAVDAAKTIAVCTVADPGATAAFRIDSRLFKKVTVKKSFLVIKTRDAK